MAIGLLGAALMLSMTLFAVPAHAQTAADLQAQIQSLLQTISALQAQLGTLQGGTTAGTGVCPYTWSRNLTKGSTGDDVMKLQKFLNSDAATRVAVSGAGSPGSESSYFGSATAAAVAKFQDKYASSVLTPVGLSKGTGYFGTMTRAKMNESCSGAVSTTPTTPTTPVVVPAGTGLTVTKAADQPANSLAPENAARVPFTKILLTAGNDGPVTVSSVVVERQGLAADTSFSGIVLMNEDGTLIGIEKTLNSEHRATVGTDFTIPAGTTKTVIVGANMDTTGNLATESGDTPSLAVVAVNTAATVRGTFPIVGATHTVNNSLSIGSVTQSRGSLDPGANQTKEVGVTGYTFSSVKFTAGSVEDLTLKSIRWYQSESASAEDIANVKTIVEGVTYDAVKDGRYYTTVFPSGGLVVKKGFSKDISIKADVAGGSDRKIDFDVDRRTDIHLVGNQYGYGIMPAFESSAASTDGAAFSNANNPFYDAAQVTISSGTMNVSTWTAGVPAQNIAVNLADQPIMGLTFDVKGEAVSIASMKFDFTLTDNTGTTIGLGDITNLTLVDQNGAVLAGPADGSGATTKSGSITLTDAVTFPTGITNAILKAKLGTDFATNDTVIASTTPGSTSYFTTVTGQVTGKTITPTPSSAVTGPTQTVKAGALTVTVSSQPTARTVISGANKFEFARYIFDASQSGEDIRVTSIPLYYDTTGTRTDLTNCQLFDGADASAVSLTTGSNVLNPTTSDTASSTSITFDGTGLVLAKGTSKTLSMRCNIKSGVTAKYWWGIDGAATMTSASGITSGQTIGETLNDANGQVMTAAANGSYTVANDTSVLFKAAQAGSADVTLARYRFEAGSTEDVDIKAITLALGNTASNTPADLVGQKVSIWNGSTKVGEAQFGLGASPDNATSTLSTSVRIPKGDTVVLTVKGSLAGHDVNSAVGAFGGVLSVNYDGNNNGLNGNYATGADSGATISGTSGDTSANATKVYRGLLTIEDVTTTSALSAGTDLYKIKLTAAAGRDVTLHALSFNVNVVGLSAISGFQLYGPSGAVNATGVATSSSATGNVGAQEKLRIIFDNAAVDRVIQAGTSKTYSLRADTITSLTASNVETVSIKLLADTAEPSGVQEDGFYNATAHMSTVNAVNNSASTTDRFVWSPNSTTTLTAAAASNSATDWTNGYGLPGYPSVGQDMSTRVFTH